MNKMQRTLSRRDGDQLFLGPWSDLFWDFDQALDNTQPTWAVRRERPTQRMSPAVDITENDHGYVLSFDIPGVKKDEIDIEVQGNSLVISGSRKLSQDINQDNYRRIERSYGEFRREFALPENVSADSIEANYENGVLHLVIPKSEAAKPKKIAIGEKSGNGLLRKIFPTETEKLQKQ